MMPIFLERDSSAALCQSDASVPSTQAALIDSHHVGVPPLDADNLSQAAAHQYLFLLSQKSESLIYTYILVVCIMKIASSPWPGP